MTPTKISLGVKPFDCAFGGIYHRRATLLRGKKHSGKSFLAAKFIQARILSGEKVLLFTDRSPEDAILDGKTANADFGGAVSSGQLVIVSYRAMPHTGPFAPFRFLPFPEAGEELGSLAKNHSASFAVFDTFVPWTAIDPPGEMALHLEHVDALLKSLDLTSLALLPMPGSASAKELSDRLEEMFPIVLETSRGEIDGRELGIVKYQGNADPSAPRKISLDKDDGPGDCGDRGAGNAQCAAQRRVSALPARFADFSAPESTVPAPGRTGDGGRAQNPDGGKPKAPIRFSDIIR